MERWSIIWFWGFFCPWTRCHCLLSVAALKLGCLCWKLSLSHVWRMNKKWQIPIYVSIVTFFFFVCDDIYHIMESYGASNSGLKTNYEKTYLLYFFHCVACLVILSAPDTRSDFSKSFNLSFSTQEAFSFCNCQETIACQIIHPYLWSDRTSDSRAPWFLSGYQSFKVLVGLWRHTSLSALSHLMFSLSKFYTERLYSQRFASCLWQKSVRNCMYLFFLIACSQGKLRKLDFI